MQVCYKHWYVVTQNDDGLGVMPPFGVLGNTHCGILLQWKTLSVVVLTDLDQGVYYIGEWSNSFTEFIEYIS